MTEVQEPIFMWFFQCIFTIISCSIFILPIGKVDITWDETDQERVTSLSKNFKKDELLDMDFQAYLASSSEEEEEEDEKEKGIANW